MFDGKNAKMIPEIFEKETGTKTFRSWESKVKLFIDLADKEAGEIIKAVNKGEWDEEIDKEENANKNKYLHGFLMMLTDGEAHNIVEANPEDGAKAWQRLKERWGKRFKMSSTAVCEKMRAVPKCKTLDEMLPRMSELDKLYMEYFEIRGEQYNDIERKANLLRIAPKELQQRLQLDVDDWDNVEMSIVIGKINNYIRSMSTGQANMDINAVDEKPIDEKNVDGAGEDEYNKEWENGNDLNYMGKGGKGDKGKGKGKGEGKGKGIKGNCWGCGQQGHTKEH
eukprot:4765767-Karenia_brevis.AAC.1